MKLSHSLALLGASAGMLALGCNSTGRSSPSEAAVSHVELTLEPSTRTLLVGETVTIVARTQDTYGRDSRVAWTSSSGDLRIEQGGRVARVRFDQAGTFTVVAVLSVEGRETRRDTVEITVKPVS